MTEIRRHGLEVASRGEGVHERRADGMIRFATIGTSWITDHFLDAALKCPEFKLEAVYSRNLEKAKAFGGKYGVGKYYDSLRKLAEDPEIDAVYIASPNSLHCAHAIQMMEAGKQVLCEKPLGANTREVAKMFQTAEEHHVALMEAVRTLHQPAYRWLQEHLAEIGPVRAATLCYDQKSSKLDRLKNGDLTNNFNHEYAGGALTDIGVYCLQAMVGLFGKPEKITGSVVKMPGLEDKVDLGGMILATYPDLTAQIRFSKLVDGFIPSEIQGEKGSFLVDAIQEPRQITLVHPDGTREEISVEVAENELIYEVEDFITYVKNRENPLKLQGDQKKKKSDTETAHEEELLDEDPLQVYEKISKDVMAVMDQVRKENGIIFPADKDSDVLKERLEQQLDFIREVDKVKLITRQTPLANGSRKENDAEHSWHLALMAGLLEEHADASVNVPRVMKMVLAHDLVEIDAGDTYAYDTEGAKTQHQRELKAAERIFGLLPKDQGEELRALWDEFEAYETADAKYAHLLDNFQPLLLNDASGGISWIEHTVHKSQIYKRNAKIDQSSKEIWDYMKGIIQKHIDMGHVKDD